LGPAVLSPSICGWPEWSSVRYVQRQLLAGPRRGCPVVGGTGRLARWRGPVPGVVTGHLSSRHGRGCRGKGFRGWVSPRSTSRGAPAKPYADPRPQTQHADAYRKSAAGTIEADTDTEPAKPTARIASSLAVTATQTAPIIAAAGISIGPRDRRKAQRRDHTQDEADSFHTRFLGLKVLYQGYRGSRQVQAGAGFGFWVASAKAWRTAPDCSCRSSEPNPVRRPYSDVAYQHYPQAEVTRAIVQPDDFGCPFKIPRLSTSNCF
jgi:hypothetical protein